MDIHRPRGAITPISDCACMISVYGLHNVVSPLVRYPHSLRTCGDDVPPSHGGYLQLPLLLSLAGVVSSTVYGSMVCDCMLQLVRVRFRR